MISNQGDSPLFKKELKLESFRELAKRSRKAGFFHVIAFLFSVYLSPLRDTQSIFCWVMFFILIAGSVSADHLYSQGTGENKGNSLVLCFFFIIDRGVFSMVCLAIIPVLFFRNGSFLLFLLPAAGRAYHQVLQWAGSSRALTSIVVLAMLVSPIVVLIWLNNKESHIMAFIFSLNVIYLMSLSKQVSGEYRQLHH